MTMQATALGRQPRNLWRSTGAVLLGFFVVVLLSLGTDEVLHLLKVYPPWGRPMFEPRLNLLALSYRIVYAVIGSYNAARFAPRNPMRHVRILGIIGPRIQRSRCGCRDHPRRPEPGVVSNFTRCHGFALRLARWTSISEVGGFTGKWCHASN